MMNTEHALELKGITKTFSGITVNDDIHFCLKKGEIHSILGENGAGKSTLMYVISGLYQPERGQILLNGEELQIRNPRHAIGKGIGMVHQHFMLIPGFTVLENIILGVEKTKRGTLDLNVHKENLKQLAKEFSFDINPDLIACDLPVGVQQKVEIIKALYRSASILIFDEPTAVLTPNESKELFNIMASLKEKGVAIIFITHKLKEVMQVSDRISVIRRGKIVSTLLPQETDENQLSRMMVGREIKELPLREQKKTGLSVFEVKNLSVLDTTGRNLVDDVSFTIQKGEIFGIAGVMGNGQTELVEAITGLGSFQEGMFLLDGETICVQNPRLLFEKGVGHIPEDRLKHGLVKAFTIEDNQVLSTYYNKPFSMKGILNKGEIRKNSERLIKSFDIRTNGPHEEVKNLSGGNQQKVIISRELNRDILFLIANQPTRGLDVGAISYVHGKIMEVRDKGNGVLLVSSELDELIKLSDRIAVIFEGRIVDVFDKEEVTKESLGVLMTSGKDRPKRFPVP